MYNSRQTRMPSVLRHCRWAKGRSSGPVTASLLGGFSPSWWSNSGKMTTESSKWQHKLSKLTFTRLTHQSKQNVHTSPWTHLIRIITYMNNMAFQYIQHNKCAQNVHSSASHTHVLQIKLGMEIWITSLYFYQTQSFYCLSSVYHTNIL